MAKKTAKKSTSRKNTPEAKPSREESVAARTSKLNRKTSKLLRTLHRDLQPLAMEMRQDQIDEVTMELQNRWKWGEYVHKATDESKYGDSQVATLAEFLEVRVESLYEVRKFYRLYPSLARVDKVLTLRRDNGQPLHWSVVLEVLRGDLDHTAQLKWLLAAADANMDYRTLRKAIRNSLNPQSDGERPVTPRQALRSMDRQNTRYQTFSGLFNTTLEQRLLQGNVEAFSDAVMSQLETTRTTLQEMLARLQEHVSLVDNCLARGTQLRQAAAAEISEQETTPVPAAPITIPDKDSRRSVGRRRNPPPVAVTESPDDDEMAVSEIPGAPQTSPVKPLRRPSAENPANRLADVRKRLRRQPQS